MNNRSFQELHALNGEPLRLKSKPGPFGAVRDVDLRVGDYIAFTTRHIDAHGRVLEIDHGATYPVKVEWWRGQSKHITSFSSDEFISIIKEV